MGAQRRAAYMMMFITWSTATLLKVCLFVVQIRKPLVEKKRRARINESLQELRSLLADTEVRARGHTRAHTHTAVLPVRVMELLRLLVHTVSLQDGECRGAGDDGEEGRGHPEESESR